MDIDRIDPMLDGDERETVLAFLDFHRATLALKCQGLTSEQAAMRSVPPSALSLLGMVRHLTDVETAWFVERFSGETPHFLYRNAETPNAAFEDLEGADIDESLRLWSESCDRSREIVSKCDSLEQISVGFRRENQRFTLRWILHHLTQEYARHNGHADLLREAIDGSVGR